MKEILINHFLNYEFVYVFLLCLIIFLSISIFVDSKIIKTISLIFFAIFFALCLLELILSFSMEKINADYHHNFYFDSINMEVFKNREIKIKSKINGNTKLINNEDYDIKLYEKVYDVIYSFYSAFRYTKCDKSSMDSYIFLGCSYVYGDGLNDDETLPYYFSNLYNFNKNVINCGLRGKASNSALNILNNEAFLPFIKKNSSIKHCVYSLMHDHIYRNFRVLCNAPSDCLIIKDKKYVKSQLIVRLKYLLARSCIFRKVFLPMMDKYFYHYYEDYIIHSLIEMNKIIEKKYNSKLTIIVWPEFNKIFVNKLRKTNLDLIFLPGFFNSEEYKIKYDGHPTAKANEEIAQKLYEHINKGNK